MVNGAVSLRRRLSSLFASVGLPLQSLRTRAACAAALAVVAGLVALGTVITVTAERNIRDSVGNQVLAVTTNTANEIRQKLDLVSNMVQEMASRTPLSRLNSVADMENFIRGNSAIFSLVNAVVIYHPDGSVAADWPPDTARRKTNYADRDWFQEVKKTGKPVLSKPFLGRNSKAPRIVFAAPVKGADPGVAAIVTATVLVTEQNMLGNVISQRLGNSGFLVVADRDGTIISHPNPERVMSPLATTGGAEALKRALSGLSGYFEGPGNNQQINLLTAAPIPGPGWVLIGVMPTAEAYRPVAQLRTQIMTFSVLLILLVGTVTWFALGRLLRPLLALRQSVERLQAMPNTTAQLDLAPHARGSKEIDAVADALTNLLNSRAQVHAARENLAAIVETSADAIISRSPDFRVLTWNAAAERLFGYSAAEVIGANSNLLIPPEREAESAHVRHLIEQGQKVPPYDSVRVTKGGRRIDVSISQAPIRDVSGRVTSVSIAFRDISERKRIESERARLAAIVEHSNDAIIGRTLDGIITSWNAGAERLLGYTASEMIGQPIALIRPPGRAPNLARNNAVVLSGELKTHETDCITKDGKVIDVRTSHSPIRNDAGDIIGAAVIMQDITALNRAERARAQLVAIVESSNDAIIGRTLDGTITSWNAGAEKMFGYTAAEAIGNKTALIRTPSRIPDRIENNSRVLRGEVVVRDSDRMTKDGRVINVLTSHFPVKNKAGDVVSTAIIMKDITALKQAERISARLAAIVESSNEAIISRDTGGTILTWNPAAERLFGWSAKEAVGSDILMFIPPGREAEVKRNREALNRGEAVAAYDTVRRRKDGTFFDTSLTQSPIKNEEGEVIAVSLIFRDITERKRAEADLREARSFLQMIVDTSPNMIFVKDEHGRLVFANKRTADYYGMTPEQMLLKSTEEFHASKSEAASFISDEENVRLTRNSISREEMNTAPDGTLHWFYAVKVPIVRPDGRVEVLGVATDITERKRAEQSVRQLNDELEVRVELRTSQLQETNRELAEALQTLNDTKEELIRSEKLAALGSLVAGVAHELNTPIGNAVTVASTLQDKSAEFVHEVQGGALRRSQLDNYAKTMAQGSELVMRNLRQAADLVTSFKQVAVDQASAQRRSFDLKEVIEEVLATLHHLVRSKPIRVVTRMAPGIQMDSYPGPLGQVINNLFNNALIHGFAGREGGEIVIETRREGEEQVVLEVRDDGNGIAAVSLHKVFDPFFTTRLGQGGSGLGLNIVHNIVTELLGGRIDVQSEPGKGACFEIVLPLVAPNSSVTVKQERATGRQHEQTS